MPNGLQAGSRRSRSVRVCRRPVAFVGDTVTIISDTVALVSDAVSRIGGMVALIGDAVTLVSSDLGQVKRGAALG